jgi:hypothetical protein
MSGRPHDQAPGSGTNSGSGCPGLASDHDDGLWRAGPGRYDDDKAVDVVQTLAGLLGHGTRWWVNGEPLGSHGVRGWNPVTRCTFDAAIVGAGNGVVVTLLAVDED